MRTIFTLFLGLLFSFGNAQTRIDSSFAFSTNPAKKYSIYVPTAYSAGTPNKMMVAFHPLNLGVWDAKSWCDTLLAFAEANDLLLICPDGGPNGDISDVIDYDFTEALIDSAKLWFNVDNSSIYAMGFSVGGLATYEFGLNHTNIFNGYIPIGAAINGTSAFTSILSNANCEPFYLVHGGNDAPSTRFTPMLNALKSNCAIVNSLLMSGVGHTINFPNRNQILSDAYFWIDSVNHASTSMSYPFGLIAPTSFSSYVVSGFQDQQVSFVWEDSKFAPGCTEYELIFDLPTGNFSSPVFIFPSGNSGADTSIVFNYRVIDSILKANAIAIGNSFTLKWAVAVKYYNKFTDTTKSFSITFTRQVVGFTLIAPLNNSHQTIANNLNLFFDWNDQLGNGITYKVLFDTLNGDFSNPIHEYTSANSGATSLRTISHLDLYYNLLLPNFNFVKGDTVRLLWTALAADSTYSEVAKSSRVLNLVIGDIGFKLVAPQNNTLVLGKQGVVLNFLWNEIPSNSVTYEWFIDTTKGGVNPLTTFPSNSSGADNSLSGTFNIIDSVLNVYGISYGDTFSGWWSVKATAGANEYLAFEPFEIQIYRAFPVGINNSPILGGIAKLFPNPAKDELYLSVPDSGDESIIINILDIRGSVSKVIGKRAVNNSPIKIDVSDLQSGIYFIELIKGNLKERHKVILN